MKKLLLAILLLATSCSAKNDIGFYKGYEVPAYQLLDQQHNIETRLYKPLLVAQIKTKGTRNSSAKASFRQLAKYIFSNDIAMTSPVMQQKIGEEWLVQFVMPAKFTQNSIAKPQNENIKLVNLASQKAVAIIFSGSWFDDNFTKHQHDLQNFINNNNISTIGEPIFAYYDDPFTFPWNRKNEIIWYIKD